MASDIANVICGIENVMYQCPVIQFEKINRMKNPKELGMYAG